MSVRAAGKLSPTVALVTDRVLVLGSNDREPVEKSMPASGALRLVPVGSAAVELNRLWAKSTPISVLTRLVPFGGSAEGQEDGVRMPGRVLFLLSV